MKKIHLLHYLLLCYMVLAVATSCGDDEDDYAPDNVKEPAVGKRGFASGFPILYMRQNDKTNGQQSH